MTKQFKAILAGIGSVMDVAPPTDYRQFVPRQSPEERMRGHWQRSGDAMRRAMARFDQEHGSPQDHRSAGR